MSTQSIIRAFAPVTIEAKAAGKLRRFAVQAYNGGPIKVEGYGLPIVVDLAGLEFAKSITANLDHDKTQRVGHIDQPQNDGRSLVLAGPVSATGAAAQEFIGNAEAGYPWQASIEAIPLAPPEHVAAGQTVTVNGQTLSGPLLVARKAKLYGVAILSHGADSSTSVALTAQRKGTMPNNQTSEAPVSELEAVKASWSGAKWNDTEGEASPYRRAQEAMISAAAGTITAEDFQKILATEQARDQELHRIRTERPKGPAVHASSRDASGEVIEAALCLSANLPDVEKHFPAPVLEAADKCFRGIGLQQVLMMQAANNGLPLRAGDKIHNGNLREVLEYALPPKFAAIHAAPSTMSLPGILSNVANKQLLSGWNDEDQTWREIATTKPVSDFKETTSYRLLDNMEYEELPKHGQIKHGELSEESYTRKVNTYAKMFGIDRQDIINDDLGAFDDLRTRIGRGAARKFNKVFWAAFMDNANFFTSDRGNFIDGADTALDENGTGLGKAVIAFRALADSTGQRIGGKPEILLCPPELEVIARRLYTSTGVNATSGTVADKPGKDAIPNGNIYQGLYRPVIADWLSDPGYTGYSATAWYLLRNPRIGSAVVVSFLFGNESPTVESADADFNTLGIQFRGYHDFGCDQAEYLAGVKVKGAA